MLPSSGAINFPPPHCTALSDQLCLKWVCSGWIYLAEPWCYDPRQDSNAVHNVPLCFPHHGASATKHIGEIESKPTVRLSQGLQLWSVWCLTKAVPLPIASYLVAAPRSASMFPAAMGCSFSPNQEQLSVVYGDRTIIVWGVKDPAKVRLSRRTLCVSIFAGPHACCGAGFGWRGVHAGSYRNQHTHLETALTRCQLCLMIPNLGRRFFESSICLL
jgi:hypothetical protein